MTNLVDKLRAIANDDAEFRLLSRHWTGTLRLDLGDDNADIEFVDGRVAAIGPTTGDLPAGPGTIGLGGPADLWTRILAPVPEPYCNDIVPAQALGLRRTGDKVTFWQYYPAVQRLVDLLRTRA